jgi:hypothetical protein
MTLMKKESEEFQKNLISNFLKQNAFEGNYFINTKGRNDLVIHNDKTAKSSVGVIMETKQSGNNAEMMTTKKLNTKAFQELVLYYLQERITHKNLEIKHLIATNVYEWFIFDAILLKIVLQKTKNLVKQFEKILKVRDYQETRPISFIPKLQNLSSMRLYIILNILISILEL